MKLSVKLLDSLINDEEKGYLQYMDLAHDAEDMDLPPSLVDALEEMAADELHHAAKLEKIQRFLSGGRW